jgi:hypothetical protein
MVLARMELLAKTFYTYEKRQKELAKQKKKGEKRLHKLEKKQQQESPEHECPRINHRGDS